MAKVKPGGFYEAVTSAHTVVKGEKYSMAQGATYPGSWPPVAARPELFTERQATAEETTATKPKAKPATAAATKPARKPVPKPGK